MNQHKMKKKDKDTLASQKNTPGVAICQHHDHEQEQQFHKHEVHEQLSTYPS